MSCGPDKLRQLLSKARGLEKVPGVYLMKDAQGRVIYIGKAVCLPDRVSSYFIPSADLGPKKQPMLELIDDFEVIHCETEWEALLTENRLIKDTHPRFNARLTDGKTYPYLVITVRDDFPGVFITRTPQAAEFRGAKVFGPFTSVGALRASVQLLQKAFRFRTCYLEIRQDDAKRRFFRPCLLYPIKQCSAPCGARIEQAAYRADIERFIRFLESKRSVMLREMRQEMQQASQQQEYEKAASLRDQIKAIEGLDDRGSAKDHWQPEAEVDYDPASPRHPQRGLEALRKVLGLEEPIRCVECIDIAHLQGQETVGAKVCFIDGKPFKEGYRRYRIRVTQPGQALAPSPLDEPLDRDREIAVSIAQGGDDYAAIREVVSRRYREAGAGQELYPELIIVDGGAGQLHAALEVFATFEHKPAMVIALAKREELIYTTMSGEPIRLPRNHVGLHLCQRIRDEAHRFAQHYHHLLREKKLLPGEVKGRRKKGTSEPKSGQAKPDSPAILPS